MWGWSFSHSRFLLLNPYPLFFTLSLFHAAHLSHHIVKLASSPSLQSKKKKRDGHLRQAIYDSVNQPWVLTSQFESRVPWWLRKKKSAFVAQRNSCQLFSNGIESPSSINLDAFLLFMSVSHQSPLPPPPSPLSLSFSLSHCVIKCFSADQPLFPECSIRVHAL